MNDELRICGASRRCCLRLLRSRLKTENGERVTEEVSHGAHGAHGEHGEEKEGRRVQGFV